VHKGIQENFACQYLCKTKIILTSKVFLYAFVHFFVLKFCYANFTDGSFWK